jgi:hypothetical protein
VADERQIPHRTSPSLSRRCLFAVLFLAAAAMLFLAPAGLSACAPAVGDSAQLAHGPALPLGRPQAHQAVPDEEFDALFTRYESGWTGGDGTYSVPLPDGRTLWMFGDTFLGTVDPDRSRRPDSPLVHNSFVVQENGSLITLRGGTPEQPKALVAPEDGSSWYWPGDGTVEGDRLHVFLRKFQRTGPGMWDWIWTGTDIGTFSLPDLKLAYITPAVSKNHVLYGSAILEHRDFVYIYGTEDLQERKFAHVARAPFGRLLGPWEFFTGHGWSDDPMESARMLDGVANQYSVVCAGNRYLLITSDNRQPFSRQIVGYLSNSPVGPWSGPLHLFTATEADDDIVTYNALAHPQFQEDGRLLISYNVNSLHGLQALFRDADAYRPRFLGVDIRGLLPDATGGPPRIP